MNQLRAKGSCPEHPVLFYIALGLGILSRDAHLSRTKALGRKQNFTPNTANVIFNFLSPLVHKIFHLFDSSLLRKGEN